jgi:mRNA interferase MazF
MRRGDIWTVAGSRDYAGKPRPVVIVQDDSFDATDSITVCAFTTDETEAPLFRLPVEPNDRNGLFATSRLMVDKITTVPKSKVGAQIGRLDDADIMRLNQAILVFLGLATSPRARLEAWATEGIAPSPTSPDCPSRPNPVAGPGQGASTEG